MRLKFSYINTIKFKMITILSLMVCSACHRNYIAQPHLQDDRYHAIYTPTTFTIDGYANEKIWKDIPFSNSLVDILTGQKPTLSTKFKIAHNRKYVFIYVELEEPHIKANMTTNDTTLYNENCFEIFIDPDQDGLNYVELEINPLQTKFDLSFDKPIKKGGTANVNFNFDDLEYAVAFNGTLNKSQDLDNHWSLEIKMSIEEIEAFNIGKNSTLASWRMHFSRVLWPVHIKNNNYVTMSKDKPSVHTWSQQSAFDNHLPDEWGVVTFQE